MNEAHANLRNLRPPRFAAFVADLAAAVWSDWEADVSPPSPGGAVEVVLRRGDRTRLVRARQYPVGTAVEAAEVEELASIRDAAGHERAVLLATTTFTEEAVAAAERAEVTRYDADAVLDLAAEADVEVPEDPIASGLLPPEAGRWPPTLVDRARDLVAFVEECGNFRRLTARASGYADLDFHPLGGEGPLVKLRFAEDCLLVYVRTDGRFRTVATLPASDPTRPPLAQLKPGLRASITRALSETRRR